MSRSIRLIAFWEVPARTASCAWVMRWRRRTERTSVPGVMIHKYTVLGVPCRDACRGASRATTSERPQHPGVALQCQACGLLPCEPRRLRVPQRAQALAQRLVAEQTEQRLRDRPLLPRVEQQRRIARDLGQRGRSEEHTSELQSLR